MSVAVIGDRAVGKTMMLVALAQQGKKIEILNQEDITDLVDSYTGKASATKSLGIKNLQLEVTLPYGKKKIQVMWIDTPGEFWQSKYVREQNKNAWEEIKDKVGSSQGIILLLPPNQEISDFKSKIRSTSDVSDDEIESYPSRSQWVNRLSLKNENGWLTFLQKYCSRVHHILICINKADLFCDIEAESKIKKTLVEYNTYIWNKYFYHADQELKNYQATRRGLPPQLFITTTKNQGLLERPWLHLAAYL